LNRSPRKKTFSKSTTCGVFLKKVGSRAAILSQEVGIHAPHEPDVDAIVKGWAPLRYGCDCEVCISILPDKGFVASMCICPATPATAMRSRRQDGRSKFPAGGMR
jgi:hypothetical protein